MSRRRNKKLSEEELREIEEFVYSKNKEEDKFLKSMSVNYKCVSKFGIILLVLFLVKHPSSGHTFLPSLI